MAHITAARAPIVIDGREYLMSPLDDRDIEEINNWFRTGIIRLARESLTPDMSQEERDEVLNAAMRQARVAEWTSPSGQTIMKTLDGVSRVIWQGVKKNHPEVTFEQVRKSLLNPADMAVTMSIWKELNLRGVATEVDSGAATEKNSRGRQRSRKRKSTGR